MPRLGTPTAIPAVERSLSARETAAALGVSLRTLWTMIERGQAPRGHRVSNKIRFAPAAIREWRAKGEAAFAAERSAA